MRKSDLEQFEFRVQIRHMNFKFYNLKFDLIFTGNVDIHLERASAVVTIFISYCQLIF